MYSALSAGGSGVHAPRELAQALPTLEGVSRGQFVRGRQEDAHEALRALLEGVQRACLRADGAVRAGKPISGADLIKETTSVSREVFGGWQRSRVHCLHCGHNSDSFEPVRGAE